eukprot:339304-Pleurochrysis_carterae.AAC.2
MPSSGKESSAASPTDGSQHAPSAAPSAVARSAVTPVAVSAASAMAGRASAECARALCGDLGVSSARPPSDAQQDSPAPAAAHARSIPQDKSVQVK